MKTKNILILSIAIVVAAIIVSTAYCYTHRYTVNERVIVDTWKKQVYPIENVIRIRDKDIEIGVPIKPFDYK